MPESKYKTCGQAIEEGRSCSSCEEIPSEQGNPYKPSAPKSIKKYENTSTNGLEDGLLGCGLGGCIAPILLMGLAGLLGGIGSPVFWPIIAFVCGVIGMFLGEAVGKKRRSKRES